MRSSTVIFLSAVQGIYVGKNPNIRSFAQVKSYSLQQIEQKSKQILELAQTLSDEIPTVDQEQDEANPEAQWLIFFIILSILFGICGVWSFYSFKKTDAINQQMAQQIREIDERRSQRAQEFLEAQQLQMEAESKEWEKTDC